MVLRTRDLALRFPGSCAAIFSYGEGDKHMHHVVESRNPRVRDFSVSSPNFVKKFTLSLMLLTFLLEAVSSEDMVNFAVPQKVDFTYTCQYNAFVWRRVAQK